MSPTKRPRIEVAFQSDDVDESITNSPIHFEGSMDPLVFLEEDTIDSDTSFETSDSEPNSVDFVSGSPTAVTTPLHAFTFDPEAAVAGDEPAKTKGKASTSRATVKKPRKLDPSRHDRGTPSNYTCYRTGCDGCIVLVPQNALVHGETARCSTCGRVQAYCPVCDGFFDDKRVVCIERPAGFVYARNGQHSLHHEPRRRVGGRRYYKHQRPAASLAGKLRFVAHVSNDI
jgi:hypothetical protein